MIWHGIHLIHMCTSQRCVIPIRDVASRDLVKHGNFIVCVNIYFKRYPSPTQGKEELRIYQKERITRKQRLSLGYRDSNI